MSSAPKRVPSRFSGQIDKQPKDVQHLLRWRHDLKIFSEAVNANAPPPEKVPENRVRHILDLVSTNPPTAELLEEGIGIDKAVKMCYKATRSKYPDLGSMAKELLERWERKDYSPGVLQSSTPPEEIEDSGSDDDDDDVDNADISDEEASRDPQTSIIMRNIQRSGNNWKIKDPNKKKDARFFGHNGIEVGQWWPLQICALRDGAHGAKIGGISGSENQGGAFSIVIAGGKSGTGTTQGVDYKDVDDFDTVLYSGSHSADRAARNDRVPKITNSTKALLASYYRFKSGKSKPVRVIRGKGATRYSPSVGLRYDGLYDVVGREVVGDLETGYHRFELKRRPDQTPYEVLKKRPTHEERRWFDNRDKTKRHDN